MRRQQSGFTLVEIAIVLVIIGLLLGGILKGQELINSAKVKAIAQDFKTVQAAMYGFQDKFRGIPGDFAPGAGTDAALRTVMGGTEAKAAATPAAGDNRNNSRIGGNWDSTTTTDESFLFWQHVRIAGFYAGATLETDVNYRPRNAAGGFLGISSSMQITAPTAMTGTYNICTGGILGKFAKQLDTQLDNGDTATGSIRAALETAATTAVALAAMADDQSYVVCMSF